MRFIVVLIVFFFSFQFCLFLHLLRREHQDGRNGCHRAEGEQQEGQGPQEEGGLIQVRAEDSRAVRVEFVKNFQVVEEDSSAARILGSGRKMLQTIVADESVGNSFYYGDENEKMVVFSLKVDFSFLTESSQKTDNS
jgi:hypothetical protein